ncbi:restriction endonuclease [Bacillus cytotoxicus]|uniref:Restriction endonuclease n=1 Tax=Bacillus cytotoxicus TaxID=580165 RepID=A0ACC6AAB6_9BACI|nr:restriction endonuclease [Bacillus cytotoxicus]
MKLFGSLFCVTKLVGAKAFYKADETWVVTNSKFTPAARKLASANRVVLIDRERLIQLSVRVNKRKVKATV